MTQLKNMHCSFCGKEQNQSVQFIASPNASCYICDECVQICSQILNDSTQSNLSLKLIKPTEIKKHLDNYIIGQENAKIALSVAVYNHYKRINYNENNCKTNRVELDKSNVLLIGPTGSGKTLLAKTLAKILNVPFAHADATTLTEAGYVGEDVESILSKLIQNAGGDIKKAEKGIIYIDEIDKIAKRTENKLLPKDPSGEGVQQGLLKIIEGTVATVPEKSTRKHPFQDNMQIDTSNILFICGGAFVGLDDIMQEKSKNSFLGFEQNSNDTKNIKNNNVEPQDLIKFGLIPEFVGRLPIVVKLDNLKEEDLVKILVEPKNSLIKQFETMFLMDGIDFSVEQPALSKIAEKALLMKSGARGLRSILENSMLSTMFSLPSEKNIAKINLCVNNRGELEMKTINKQKTEQMKSIKKEENNQNLTNENQVIEKQNITTQNQNYVV